MRELLILVVLAGLGLLTAGAVGGTEALLRLATVRPITLRLPGSYLMKSAIAQPDVDTEIVPAEIVPAAVDYPPWLDDFDHQISALVQLARQGNRIAYNIVFALNDQHTKSSDQASDVAAILEQPGRSGS